MAKRENVLVCQNRLDLISSRIVDEIRAAKGLAPLGDELTLDDEQGRDQEYDRLADILEAHIDVARIRECVLNAISGSTRI